jgi:hypothetical protein
VKFYVGGVNSGNLKVWVQLGKSLLIGMVMVHHKFTPIFTILFFAPDGRLYAGQRWWFDFTTNGGNSWTFISDGMIHYPILPYWHKRGRP